MIKIFDKNSLSFLFCKELWYIDENCDKVSGVDPDLEIIINPVVSKFVFEREFSNEIGSILS